MSAIDVGVQLRLAASLAHAVPGVKLDLDDGEVSDISIRMSPCQLRSAIAHVMETKVVPNVSQPLVSILQSPSLSVTLLEGRARVFGGDIVGFVCCTTAVFAFATTLSPVTIRSGIAGRPMMHRIRTQVDELLKTTLVYLEVDLHHRLEPGWKEIALAEIREAMVGCMRADIEASDVRTLWRAR